MVLNVSKHLSSVRFSALETIMLCPETGLHINKNSLYYIKARWVSKKDTLDLLIIEIVLIVCPDFLLPGVKYQHYHLKNK